MSTTTEAPDRHFGWFRLTRRDPWRKLAEGPDFAACWHLLVATAGLEPGELCCLPADQVPRGAIAQED